jgi:hypothetical protein
MAAPYATCALSHLTTWSQSVFEVVEKGHLVAAEQHAGDRDDPV